MAKGIFDLMLNIPVVRNNWAKVRRVIIGIPSIIDGDNNFVLSTPNIPFII